MILTTEGRTISSRGARADSWIALVYHDVRPAVAQTGGGPDHFATPLNAFELMLDTILERGYIGCSLATALERRGSFRVAITFDDGTKGQYEYAFPALAARGMTATFYVTTDWIGRPGFMTWAHVREMAASGMSIQSHTCSHPFLSELDADGVRSELVRSKQMLDSELSQDTSEIAFPGGDAPASGVRYIIREAGYGTAVGSRWGLNRDDVADDTFVRRCTARGEITQELARRVVDADAWLRIRSAAREGTLRRIRSTLGASRYARWRRGLLDSLPGRRG